VKPRADKVAPTDTPPPSPPQEEPSTEPSLETPQIDTPSETDQGLSESIPTEGVDATDPFESTETPQVPDLSETPDVPDSSDSSDIPDMSPPTFDADEPSGVTEDISQEEPQEPQAPSSEGTSIPDFDDQMGQGQGGQQDIFGDLVSPIESSDGDLTEKILQDLESQTKSSAQAAPKEYVAPPDYEYPGRGLVYNCKALHWACVDGPSYKTCEENALYLKENNKAPECYPFNVYETSNGCVSMQNRMVSSGASTDFCNEY